jgi:tripartite-type tricarboxylate transporter receptor subunit TctC
MPGGGGVVASNYVYNVAPQDGTTLIVITSTFAVEQLLNSPQIKYDARNFRGIGRMTDTTSTVTFWRDADVKSAADLFTKPSIVAVAAVNEIWSVRLLLMNQLLGARMKLVAGYPSGADKVLALERREADGFWMPYITLAELYPSYLKEQKLRIILQSATTRNRDIPDVPTMLELTGDREIQQVFRYLVSNGELGRSLFTTPGVPPTRVGLLRSAFQAMLRDSEFQADAKKIGLPLGSASGEEVDKIVLDTFSVSPSALQRVKDLMKTN